MTRREAIGTALVVVLLAGTITPAVSAAELQTFTLRPVTFIQSHLYEGALREPESVHVDMATGEIWVADPRNNLVGVFSPDGIPLFAFSSARHLRNPRQIAVDSRGRVLVLEHDRTRIRQFDYRGRFLGDLVPPSLPPSAQIGAIAFGPDGSLYVGENSGGEVFVYHYPTLRLRQRFGSKGEEEGQFRSIAGMAVDENFVYVLDHVGLAVQLFDHRGDFVRGWGQHAMGGANFSLPRGIAVDPKGRIIVVDGLRHDIKYFDAEGRFIGHFGGVGPKPGNTTFPTGVAVGPDGRVYVSERGNSRIQVFEEESLAKRVPVP